MVSPLLTVTAAFILYLSENVSDGALNVLLPSSIGSEIQLDGYEIINVLLGSSYVDHCCCVVGGYNWDSV
jgi:hypothetical protein